MNAPAMTTEPAPGVSLDELDARIDAQLTLLASIDAQRADRAATVESGDLDVADYRAWLVRALDRRGYALQELVALRHARYTAAQAEECARTEVARLRLALQRAQAENEAPAEAPSPALEAARALLAHVPAGTATERAAAAAELVREALFGDALAQVNGNRVAAAELLGVPATRVSEALRAFPSLAAQWPAGPRGRKPAADVDEP